VSSSSQGANGPLFIIGERLGDGHKKGILACPSNTPIEWYGRDVSKHLFSFSNYSRIWKHFGNDIGLIIKKQRDFEDDLHLPAGSSLKALLIVIESAVAKGEIEPSSFMLQLSRVAHCQVVNECKTFCSEILPRVPSLFSSRKIWV
jgi:hypothetical protein